MKSPITGKEMSIQIRNMDLNFRKETFNVSYPSFYCEDSKQYFTNTEFDTVKMKQVYNQYRDMYNLPFPEEILQIRSKYELSATRMSELLGFGVNSYRNYEAGEVPSQSNANLIQLASDPSQFKSLVKISSVFGDDLKSKNTLIEKIEKLVSISKKNRYLMRFENYLLGNKLPDNYSGYRKPDIEKLTEMVVYFAQNMTPFITALNKFLFYSDFLYYSKEAVSMSGTRYRAIDKGPVPNNYDSIYEYMEESGAITIIKREYDWGYSKEFQANRDFDSDKFNDEELNTLKNVFTVFKGKNTTEIVEKSHLEDGWKDNFENGKSLIDYNKYAFNLKI